MDYGHVSTHEVLTVTFVDNLRSTAPYAYALQVILKQENNKRKEKCNTQRRLF